ncbi:hypothetical protein [Streptomyces sp. TLI_105]|uniref:hypothetical protein n=1 Tax=Streptomyces sp. TLI_105 TaxID=1881019 RepID=UPI0008947F75|nr:hypothetical protein [Streptomyces sp. TLI_105]SEE25423.1 hypothetical protein SAMN05428939_7891 [Streptomyces sp. TLI_105]
MSSHFQVGRQLHLWDPGRPDGAAPGWQAGVEWTLLWIENTAAQLTEGGPSGASGRQGVSPK